MRIERSDPRAGFTLIEVLVALSVLLAFAAALGPHLFQARQILDKGKGRVAANILLRSLIDAPFDRAATGVRRSEGETNGLRWRLVAEPMFLPRPPLPEPMLPDNVQAKEKKGPSWGAFRVVAIVSWGNGQSMTAETLRLAKLEGESP
jgi:general secretion pathway protein I